MFVELPKKDDQQQKNQPRKADRREKIIHLQQPTGPVVTQRPASGISARTWLAVIVVSLALWALIIWGAVSLLHFVF